MLEHFLFCFDYIAATISLASRFTQTRNFRILGIVSMRHLYRLEHLCGSTCGLLLLFKLDADLTLVVPQFGPQVAAAQEQLPVLLGGECPLFA